MDTLTGETGEQKLDHASGEAERFYRGVPRTALIGMESTGNCQWFVELLTTLEHEVWIGDGGWPSPQTGNRFGQRGVADSQLLLLKLSR